MSLSLNKVMLAGNLARDPEVKKTASGFPFCIFVLAVNSKFKEREETLFIDIDVFGNQSDACGKYLSKGSSVFVEGRLIQDSWQDKNGEKRTRHKIIADRVQFNGNSSGGRKPEPRMQGVSEEYAPPMREGNYARQSGNYAEVEEEMAPF